MGFTVVIPARYASQRLPGKPLLDICGRPMIEHTYRCAERCGAERVIVATDDRRIEAAVTAFGGEAIMTSSEHRTGTDRLAEVVETLGLDDEAIVVNLQGDEPMMPPELLGQVAENLAREERAHMATLITRVHTAAELFDPHMVKVVTDKHGFALYFSRAVIPWDRDAFAVTTQELPERAEHYRHLGIYGYRAGFLREYATLESCHLEEMESLEQLRVLWHGYRIHVDEATALPGPGVDTEADLERVRERVAAEG